MNANTATDYLRYDDQTVRSSYSQAYSQCLPEPNYGHSPEPNYGYGSYYSEQAPLPQQPMPVQTPAPRPSSGSKGLLFVAGLAVVGAAAFGGVYLMNSSSSEPTSASASAPAAAQAPVINVPSAIEVSPPAPAPAPVIVNNPAPVRVSGPVSVPRSITTQKPVTASKPATAPAPAAAPAPAPAPAPAAPAPQGPTGVAIKTPFTEVGVDQNGTSVKAPGVEVGTGQNGTSVKTPGVEVGVPGQNGGQVVVGVPGPQTPAKTEGTQNSQAAGTEGAKPAGGAGTTAEGSKQVGNIADVAGPLAEATGGASQVAGSVAGG